MRAFSLSLAVATFGIAAAACAPAFGQIKVAAAALPSSPKPMLAGAALSIAGDEATPLTPELLRAATRTVDLDAYAPPRAPPAITCPAGSTLTKTTRDNGGWEAYCARGSEKHGPYHGFETRPMREVRAVYENGKLHGEHVEITLSPVLSSGGPAPPDFLAAAQTALTAGWPLAAPADPTCPPGTRLARLMPTEVRCELVDGAPHGPRLVFAPGTVTWTTMSDGTIEVGAVSLDDRRTARESTYAQGQLTRVLEHRRQKRLFVEVHRGDEVAILHFAESTSTLSRTRKGKLHGAQLRWDGGGVLIDKTSYSDGVETESGQWQSGQLTHASRLDASGNGTAETLSGSSLKRCQMEARRPRLCETTTDKGVLVLREVHEEGILRGQVAFWLDGTRQLERRYSPAGAEIETKQWSAEGRLQWQRSCDGTQCTATQWDNLGQATTTSNPDGSGARPAPAPEPLTGPLNALRDLLGVAAPKPPAKVAAPASPAP